MLGCSFRCWFAVVRQRENHALAFCGSSSVAQHSSPATARGNQNRKTADEGWRFSVAAPNSCWAPATIFWRSFSELGPLWLGSWFLALVAFRWITEGN